MKNLGSAFILIFYVLKKIITKYFCNNGAEADTKFLHKLSYLEALNDTAPLTLNWIFFFFHFNMLNF